MRDRKTERRGLGGKCSSRGGDRWTGDTKGYISHFSGAVIKYSDEKQLQGLFWFMVSKESIAGAIEVELDHKLTKPPTMMYFF